jgi:hypothetical protein
MGVTLKTVLDAATAGPVAIEAKLPKFFPKISKALLKVDTMIPPGPAIWPAPPAGGFPTTVINKIPNPPKIFGSPLAEKVDFLPLAEKEANAPDVNFLQRHTQSNIGGSTVMFK